MLRRRRLLAVLFACLALAGLLRAWVLASNGIVFDSDEAVFDLMARHVNQGKPVPTFVYGQAYLGTLELLPTALAFRVFGESVLVGRAFQACLYLLEVAAGGWLAFVVTRSRRVTAIALVLLAFPPVMITLYTSLPLGGWNSVVLLSALVLGLAWQITVEHKTDPWRWAALGLAAGAGWWVQGAIVTAIIVAGLMGLRRFSPRHGRGYLLAAAGFLVGSAPWWLYNLTHEWEALRYLTTGYTAGGEEPLSNLEAVIALLGMGLPTLYGLRAPADQGFTLAPRMLLALPLYLLLLTDFLVTLPRRRGRRLRRRGAVEAWIGLIFGVFAAVFVASSFFDATGRYLLPLWVPATIGLALGIDRLRRAGWALAAAVLALLVAFQVGTTVRLTQQGDGLPFQLYERLQIPPRYDAPLLDFLDEHGYDRGYASYWTSYRLIFKSGEAVILDSSLPFAEEQVGADGNRYPPYVEMVAQAERVVWITQNFPALDRALAQAFAARGIRYQTRDFGPYRVYYDFSRRVTPAEIGLSEPAFLEDAGAE